MNFFRNYFVTGDYVVGSVGLRGTDGTGLDEDGMADDFATRTLHMSGVPTDGVIIAAFMYWQTIVTQNQGSGTDGVQFRGEDITASVGSLEFTSAELLNPAGTTPCWSNGGAAGPSDGAHNLLSYRTDVLRFLPRALEPDANGILVPTGQRLVNDADLLANGYPLTTVRMPDTGGGNQVPVTSGVSLVVIYRDPNPAAALRSIVIYDGGYSLDQAHEDMTQTIEGFYQASTESPDAKMTHIVGDGQGDNKSERVLFNGVPIDGQPPDLGPFVGSAGERWDSLTFPNLSLPGDAASAIVRVDHGDPEFTPYDCLSWSAILFSTTVQDTDEDGLLDTWETDSLTDPNGQPLPNLVGIANPLVKDLFYQIDFMTSRVEDDGPGEYSTPAEGLVSAHRHLPDYGALRMMAASYKNSPVKNPTPACGPGPTTNPCGPTGIRVHFDTGQFYQEDTLVENGTEYHPSADGYIIPAGQAHGGQAIVETQECTVEETCAFPGYYGVVGWKSAYLRYRDEALNYDAEDCVDHEPGGLSFPGAPCERRFDRNRHAMFHYVLWAHFLGRPRSTVNDPNTPYDDTKTPKTTSGIADFPGGDVMMTLGGFVDVRLNLTVPYNTYNGTTVTQASTLMHETGHNLWLRHGDAIGEPNCKPNNLTVMNYLFQLAALVKDNGDPAIDYAKQPLPALDETSLREATGLGSMPYRTRWFAYRYPAPGGHDGSAVDQQLGTTAAKRHCDGTPLLPGEIDPLNGNPNPNAMVRVEGTTVAAPIDWDADGQNDGASPIPGQDISFNGTKTPLSASTTEWDKIDLQQLASRRNAGNALIDALSVGFGLADQGPAGDEGVGDEGVGDEGVGDEGVGDEGVGDEGVGDEGVGDEASLEDGLGSAPTSVIATPSKTQITITWGKVPVGVPNSQASPPGGSPPGDDYSVHRVEVTRAGALNLATKIFIGGLRGSQWAFFRASG